MHGLRYCIVFILSVQSPFMLYNENVHGLGYTTEHLYIGNFVLKYTQLYHTSVDELTGDFVALLSVLYF